MCTYIIISCIVWLHVLLRPYELSGVTNNVAVFNVAMICVYLQFAGSYVSQKKNH